MQKLGSFEPLISAREQGGSLILDRIQLALKGAIDGLSQQVNQLTTIININVGGPSSFEVPLTFSTGLTRIVNTITANLSTGIAGGQSAIGGTGPAQNLGLSSTTNPTKGTIIADSPLQVVSGNSAVPGIYFPDGFLAGFHNIGGGTIRYGVGVFAADYIEFSDSITTLSTSPGVGFHLQSASKGMVTVGPNVFIYGNGQLALGGNSSTPAIQGTTDTSGFTCLNYMNGVPTGVPTSIPVGHLPVTLDASDDRFYAYNASWKPYGQYTGGLATGLLKNTTGTGLWTIAVSADVAGAITWPAATDVLYSSGVSTAPSGDSLFTFDAANHALSAGSELLVGGATNAANIVLRTFQNGNRDHVEFFVGGGSSPGASDNTLLLISQNSGTTIPAGRTTGIWATLRVQPNGYIGSSSPTVTEATTLYVDGAPTLTTATGQLFAVHVAAGEVAIGSSATQTWYNLEGVTNFERVKQSWGSYGSFTTWIMKAEKGGTGTLRQMLIDGATSNLILGATGSGGTVGLGVNPAGTSSPAILASATSLDLRPDLTAASSAGLVFDPIRVPFRTTIITGTTHITNTTGVNLVAITGPTYDGGAGTKTIDFASTFAIYGPPTGSNGITITNPISLWVVSGKTALDGNVRVGGSAAVNVGFFGSGGTTLTTVTGSRAGNAALASLMTALGNMNLVTDGTTP